MHLEMVNIAIIDYGMGNLGSVEKAFEHVGHRAFIAHRPEDVLKGTHVVLPGVGGFAECMENLRRKNMIDVVYESIRSGRPFLGICLGLQLLFSESEEFGLHRGLDIIKGRVKRLKPGKGLKVPHMGWNQIRILREVPHLKGIPDKAYVYFVHSYHVVPEEDMTISTLTDYGEEFVSSIYRDNIFACQFHPEKSHNIGLQILKNFGDLK